MMRTVWMLLVSTLLYHGTLSLAAVSESTPGETPGVGPFEVGQRWLYDHEGPRPGAMEPNAIDGQRILKVVSQAELGGQRLWIIEERFTHDPNVVSRLYVDDMLRLLSLDITNQKGEAMRLTYESGIAYQAMAMDVGEQRTVKTRLLSTDGKLKLPIQIEVQRFEDETVDSPAGLFEDSRHFEFAMKSSIDLKLVKIPIEETRHRWYSDQVHGLVKEVYEKKPGKFMTWSWEGYTSTSTLASFGLGDVDGNTAKALGLATSDFGFGQDVGADPSRGAPWLWGVLGCLVAGVCLLAGVLLVKRRR
ncbi:MAG: hypothetical protein HQ515_07060 [Phycisphaeraceae bacterium]|nr:hypothetical protein [Phycisphaeraceae bacterium]